MNREPAPKGEPSHEKWWLVRCAFRKIRRRRHSSGDFSIVHRPASALAMAGFRSHRASWSLSSLMDGVESPAPSGPESSMAKPRPDSGFYLVLAEEPKQTARICVETHPGFRFSETIAGRYPAKGC